MQIWSTLGPSSSWVQLRVLDAVVGIVSAVATAGGMVVTGSGGDEFVLHLWNTTSWKPVQKLTGHTGVIHAIVEVGDAIVAASADATISVRRGWVGGGGGRSLTFVQYLIAGCAWVGG